MRSRANYINLSKLPVQFNANRQMVFMMNENKKLHMFTKFVIFFVEKKKQTRPLNFANFLNWC